MQRHAYMGLLVLLILMTGCLGNSSVQEQQKQLQQDVNDTQQQAEKIVACSTVLLRIIDASATEAVIQQTGGDPVGEIQVIWTLENGETATDTITIDHRGAIKQATNNLKGTLQQVTAEPVACPSAQATYP